MPRFVLIALLLLFGLSRSLPAEDPLGHQGQVPKDQDQQKQEPAGTQEKVPEKKDVFRTWTDSTGKFRVSAKYAGVKEDSVQLTKKDGKTIQLPLEKLSAEDQRWIKDTLADALPEEKAEQKKKLAAKKLEHTSWTVRVATKRAGVATVGSARPTKQTVQGELVSYKRGDVVVNVADGKGRLTLSYGSLGKSDQRFVDEYRKLASQWPAAAAELEQEQATPAKPAPVRSAQGSLLDRLRILEDAGK